MTELASRIRPDDTCTFCSGTGHEEKDATIIVCRCVLRKQAIQYLTPEYADATFLKAFNAEAVKTRNLVFIETQPALFKAAVKSFLLLTAMQYTHASATGREIIEAYVSRSAENDMWSVLSKTDYLFLELLFDPPNKQHGVIITSLLDRRLAFRKPTWVLTKWKLDNPNFDMLYQVEMGDFLRAHFTPASF